jgi:hypothetical protein
MSTTHFYTIRVDGKEYAAVSRYYGYKRAAAQIGVTREQIVCRGADSRAQYWQGKAAQKEAK